MNNDAARIAENVACVRGRIADAAARSGRPAHQITLVAVTKYVPVEMVRPLIAAGCVELGESRPQQLWEKAAALGQEPVRWHLIGHLQRNKVRRTLPLVGMIHSIDSARLLAAVEEECSHPLPALLEVNISGEAAKQGLAPESIEAVLAAAAGCRNVAVRGLMCMASLDGGPEAARRDFAALRELRDRLRPRCPPGVTLQDLSMGMSGDYEIAIEGGATMVRVGSALFEGVDESGQ
jgi:hypothetical protein